MWEFFRIGRWQDVTLILIVTILGLLLLVANPGYYSHDELQKLDHVEKYGIQNYISAYVGLSQGDGFGVPVRPIPFLVQGLLALAMRDYPVIVHIADVLSHATVAVLVFFVLVRFGFSRAIALGSACFFAINPMAIIAVGWSAALMDRWFVFFSLIALLVVDSYIRRRSNVATLAYVSILVLAAILSKETAIMLPGVMLFFLLIDPLMLRNTRFWHAFAAMILPVLVYIFYRLPAILSSFKLGSTDSYSASLSNVFDGLIVYFGYPFAFALTEAVNWIFVPPFLKTVSVVLHFAIVLLLLFLKGYRFAFGYVYGYLLFLAPVLFISIKGAHYLYASSIFFSLAIVLLIADATTRFLFIRLFGSFLLLLALFHSVTLQLFVYRIGSSMDTALTSLEAVHMTLGGPQAIEMRAEQGAPKHILHRFSTGRDKIGNSYPISMKVVEWDAPKSEEATNLVMDRQSRIYLLH